MKSIAVEPRSLKISRLIASPRVADRYVVTLKKKDGSLYKYSFDFKGTRDRLAWTLQNEGYRVVSVVPQGVQPPKGGGGYEFKQPIEEKETPDSPYVSVTTPTWGRETHATQNKTKDQSKPGVSFPSKVKDKASQLGQQGQAAWGQVKQKANQFWNPREDIQWYSRVKNRDGQIEQGYTSGPDEAYVRKDLARRGATEILSLQPEGSPAYDKQQWLGVARQVIQGLDRFKGTPQYIPALGAIHDAVNRRYQEAIQAGPQKPQKPQPAKQPFNVGGTPEDWV